jgi:hypothetical protein
MREKIIENKWVVFILIQVYFFIFNLNKTDTNISKISNENWSYFFIHIIISFAVYFIFNYLKKDKGTLYGLFIISIFQFFIFYKQIAKNILSTYINLGNKYLIYFIFIVLVTCIILLIINKFSKNTSSIIKICFISLVLLNSIELITYFNKNEDNAEISYPIFKKNSPNLILVIVDEMTSLDIINKKLNGRVRINTKLLHEYKNTYSTHKETIFSINNLLNLGESNLSLLNSPINLVTKSLKNNKLVKLLKYNEYNIINESIFQISDDEKIHDNIGFYFFENTTLTYSSLYNNMYVPLNVGFNKFMIEKGIKNIDSTFFHNFKNENIIKTNKLISLFKDTSNRKFAYFHLTVPHEPYCFDSNCNISLDKNKYYARQSKDYINSAKFASNLIQKIIDSFENSPAKNNTIIIIQGDHGARVLDIPLTEEDKLSIIDLVYIPNKKQINIKNKHTHVDEINYLIKTEFLN